MGESFQKTKQSTEIRVLCIDQVIPVKIFYEKNKTNKKNNSNYRLTGTVNHFNYKLISDFVRFVGHTDTKESQKHKPKLSKVFIFTVYRCHSCSKQ